MNGPVTFGLINPTVLLPESFLSLEASQQSAIVCHEFVHIRRNDPVKVFGEELLRSALWFHPCVWWLLGRIQLCREQVVDEATIAITEDRESYLETLLTFARRSVLPDLAPATTFFKKSHLLERVKSIAQEVAVPRALRVIYAVALHVAMPCLLALTIWRMPLIGQSRYVPDSQGVSVLTPHKLMHRMPIQIPAGVTTGGTVIVHVTLDGSGEVRNVRVVEGPERLRPIGCVT